MLEDLVLKTRTYRRFYQNERIPASVLRECINLARFGPSGANMQPLKYKITTEEEECAQMFEQVMWAGYLTDWDGPEEGERPTGYITVLGDQRISKEFGVDHGIASQNIMLGLTERGWGGCIMGAIKRANIAKLLNLPDHFSILLVIATGKPKEQVKLEETSGIGEIRYYRDTDQTHFVPKRRLDDIILD